MKEIKLNELKQKINGQCFWSTRKIGTDFLSVKNTKSLCYRMLQDRHKNYLTTVAFAQNFSSNFLNFICGFVSNNVAAKNMKRK